MTATEERPACRFIAEAGGVQDARAHCENAGPTILAVCSGRASDGKDNRGGAPGGDAAAEFRGWPTSKKA